eukprot:g64562.t1
MLYLLAFLSSVIAQMNLPVDADGCPIPQPRDKAGVARIKQTSGLSLVNNLPVLTLDVSFPRTHRNNYTNPYYFRQCPKAGGGWVVPNVTGAGAAPGVPDPDDICNRVCTVTIHYTEFCDFRITDTGSEVLFEGELYWNTAIDFTNPFPFTRYIERPLLFFITFPKTYNVSSFIIVRNPDQCDTNDDCNGFPCMYNAQTQAKECVCNDPNGIHVGTHCEYDLSCPTISHCPSQISAWHNTTDHDNHTVLLLLPLSTALPGHLNQIINRVPSYVDNQVQRPGQPPKFIYAKRTINGNSVWVAGPGSVADNLLFYNFPFGLSDVVYEVRDEAGNMCECVFRVNVTDIRPPDLTCPPSIITNQWGSWGRATAVDLIDPAPAFMRETVAKTSTFN